MIGARWLNSIFAIGFKPPGMLLVDKEKGSNVMFYGAMEKVMLNVFI